MICNECWESIKDSMVGKTNEANQKCIGISRTKSMHFPFGIDFYPIFITYEEPVKSGKNKGKIKKDESILLLKTKFCCMCKKENTSKEVTT